VFSRKAANEIRRRESGRRDRARPAFQEAERRFESRATALDAVPIVSMLRDHGSSIEFDVDIPATIDSRHRDAECAVIAARGRSTWYIGHNAPSIRKS
jgi:hypothetical protein